MKKKFNYKQQHTKPSGAFFNKVDCSRSLKVNLDRFI